MERIQKRKKVEEPLTKTNKAKYYSDVSTKLRIIEHSEKGERVADIARKFNMKWTTVKDIINNKEKYRDVAQHIQCSTKVIQPRKEILHLLEAKLLNWLQRMRGKGKDVSTKEICEMARIIFVNLKKDDPSCTMEFKASSGWFRRFQRRAGLQLPAVKTDKAGVEVGELVETVLERERLPDATVEDKPVDEDDYSDTMPQSSIEKLEEIIDCAQKLKTLISSFDPQADRALKTNLGIDSDIEPYVSMFHRMLKSKGVNVDLIKYMSAVPRTLSKCKENVPSTSAKQ